MWEGKQKEQPVKKNTKVSVSQPISGTRQIIPSHQESRADNRQAQIPPPQQPVQQPQETSATSQDNYSPGSQNSLLAAAEPMAANQALGGGGSWSAW